MDDMEEVDEDEEEEEATDEEEVESGDEKEDNVDVGASGEDKLPPASEKQTDE